MTHAASVNRLVLEPLLSPRACDALLAGIDEPWRDGTVVVPGRGDGLHSDSQLRRCQLAPLGDPSALAILEDVARRLASQHFGFHVEGFHPDDRPAVMRYRVGSHFAWHSDVGPDGTPSATRKLSLTVQLSDPSSYEGGDLQLALYHLADPSASTLATRLRTRGQVVAFPSFRTHRVTPVSRGVRYAIVAWLHGEPFV